MQGCQLITNTHSFIRLTPSLASSPPSWQSARTQRWKMANSERASIGSWIKWPVHCQMAPKCALLHCHLYLWASLFCQSAGGLLRLQTAGKCPAAHLDTVTQLSHDLRIWSLINCHPPVAIATAYGRVNSPLTTLQSKMMARKRCKIKTAAAVS